MRIRCGNCHGPMWLELAGVSAATVSLACPTCGKGYRLDVAREVNDGGKRLAADARQLARETQIDLPSAYSVLMGVISLPDVLALADASSSSCPAIPDASSSGPGKALAFDPAFRPAVEAGLLTPSQATQRGLRHEYAAQMARRHRLPEALALEVADNRISLLQALRRRGPAAGVPSAGVPAGGLPADLAVPPPPSRGWVAGVALAVVVIVAAIAFQLSKGPQGPASPGVARLSLVVGAEVLSDEWGRALEISAADPKSVLEAFCAADADRRFEPVDISVSGNDRPGERLGLLRRTGRSGEILAIVLREDRARNRWVAGDGTSQLVPRTAPPAAAAQAISRR